MQAPPPGPILTFWEKQDDEGSSSQVSSSQPHHCASPAFTWRQRAHSSGQGLGASTELNLSLPLHSSGQTTDLSVFHPHVPLFEEAIAYTALGFGKKP